MPNRPQLLERIPRELKQGLSVLSVERWKCGIEDEQRQRRTIVLLDALAYVPDGGVRVEPGDALPDGEGKRDTS